MKFAIVTGASRGLGEAIAVRLLQEQMTVISVSRTENEQLKKLALEKGFNYTYYHCNLSLEKQVQEVFLEIAQSILTKNPEEIYLFNNAGVIEPIETVGNLDQTPILRNIQVNLIAPILITNIFINKAGQTNSKVIVTNITSGAATRPIEGWSVYCTSKAGLNMFTETVAIEQATQNTQNKIIAFSPGVMDTDMQTTIRSSSKDAFKELEKFVEFKEKNKLLSADVVGSALVDFILKDDVVSGKVYHISDLIS
ncbi:(S)-benzoin forming benzil reductase [Bacillus sp. MRMR6]|uniref:(S)-benzoin forming benzil reductase n=1 Tax=Bacillus sp. MRMR6 TaxID=1928617 RepID=UPI00095159A2|nr:(S)-benzoin forming benzil reductase [Bacillus sp. MRMR6]OLS35291.1 short-chain dehydrogenase [Bacillus sp. MRMR6]